MQFDMGGLEKALEEMERRTPGTIDKFVDKAGEQLLGIVKPATRVNKKKNGGTLRRGWDRTDTVNGRTEVYNNVEYVNHIEWGHRIVGGPDRKKVVGFWKGDHMLRDSVNVLARNFPDVAEAAMEELMSP